MSSVAMPSLPRMAPLPLLTSMTGRVSRRCAARPAFRLPNCLFERRRNMAANVARKYASVHTDIPGPLSLHEFACDQMHIAPGIQTIATLSRLTIDRGEGCILYDLDGNGFIDFFAGVGVASLGYNHPRYVRAM